jgi:hypothetical protein
MTPEWWYQQRLKPRICPGVRLVWSEEEDLIKDLLLEAEEIKLRVETTI